MSNIDINELISLLKNDTISEDDAVLINNMNRKLKTEYVLKMHVRDDGTKRVISEATNSIPFYHTYVAGKKKLKASTYDGLIDKLYDYYKKEENDYSFASMFSKGLLEKAKLKGFNDLSNEELGKTNQGNTIHRDQISYNRFITDEFGGFDIRDLDTLKVRNYVVETLTRIINEDGKKLPKTEFRKFKGVLNLAFGYADSHNICDNFIRNPDKFRDADFGSLVDSSKKRVEQKVYSPEQIEKMKEEVLARMPKIKQFGECYTYGYMFLFSMETGARVGELCSLKWSDVYDKYINIHTQQIKNKATGTYIELPWTKNEKGNSQGGRKFPLTTQIKGILEELKEKQSRAGISSEYIFACDDGSWQKNDIGYVDFLMRLSKKFGYEITNNHAIRMYVNSYVLIPKGIDVNDRAKLLGHSVEVNLKNYTFESVDYCEKALDKLNS